MRTCGRPRKPTSDRWPRRRWHDCSGPARRHLPDEPFLTEEIPAPCTIPLPGAGRPVEARQGGPHLPDPPWITTGDR